MPYCVMYCKWCESMTEQAIYRTGAECQVCKHTNKLPDPPRPEDYDEEP